MGDTTIEWADTTWNPVTGCVEVSPGCDNCYAKRFAERWRGTAGHPFENGFDLTLRPERLLNPLGMRKPRRIFVNSMSDLFHDSISDDFIARIFAVMALTARHTFQLLTKRHGRMRSLLSTPGFAMDVAGHATDLIGSQPWKRWQLDLAGDRLAGDSGRGMPWSFTSTETGGQLWVPPWPLPNLWLLVSVENQHWANMRIPALLRTPAAVRGVSVEPMLGAVDLTDIHAGAWVHLNALTGATCDPHGQPLSDPDHWPALNWVVVGGESGPGARPMHPSWTRSLRDRCVAAGTPFFFKQHGAWVEADRQPATHLLHVDGKLVDRANATMDYPYGASSGVDQDLVDRGHPGWVRVRHVGRKKATGRILDGRTWDQFPEVVAA